MRHFIVGAGLLVLGGCAAETQQATQTAIAQKEQPAGQPTLQPVTPTVVWSMREVYSKRPTSWRSEVDPKQLKALPSKKAIIRTYLSNVEKEVLKLVSPESVSKLKHNDWKEKLDSNRTGENYGGTLLLTVNRKNRSRGQPFRAMPGV